MLKENSTFTVLIQPAPQQQEYTHISHTVDHFSIPYPSRKASYFLPHDYTLGLHKYYHKSNKKVLWHFHVNPIDTEYVMTFSLCTTVLLFQRRNSKHKWNISFFSARPVFLRKKKKITSTVHFVIVSYSREEWDMIFVRFLGPEQSRNSQIAKVLTPWLGDAAAKPFWKR